MNLKIILYQPYPHGFACTNRIHLYSKGITELGGHVEIFVPRPTELRGASIRNDKCFGVYEGVPFSYTCGVTVRPDSFFKRRFVNTKGIVKAVVRLYREKSEVDSILLVTNDLRTILIYSIVAKMFGIKVFQEKSELPFYNKQPKNLLEKLYQHLYVTYCYKLFDGMLVISKTLHEYFQPKIKKTAGLLLVPVIMDPKEFEGENRRSEGISIVYCGNFTQSQDGILSLIEAFKIASERLENVRLRLIGEPVKEEDKDTALRMINELGLSSRVELTGYVSRDVLVNMLKSASLLALAKPKSLQADFCFPSKLAEYLVTGNPVVVTKVGVIQDYLVDRENAYLAEPGDIANIAENIFVALTDNILSNKIGESGRHLALAEFSYQQQAKRIINFISGLPVNT